MLKLKQLDLFTSMKLLILDLDETLIHSTEAPLEVPPGIPYDFRVGDYYSYKRPGLEAFLHVANSLFELAVWTSSTQSYAEIVVKEIFPAHFDLKFVWARDRCTWRLDPEKFEHEWLKNLSKVKRRGYSLDHVLIIDDTPAKLAKNYGNLIRVKPFEGEQSDSELADLCRYLPMLTEVPSVRSIEKRNWRQKILQAKL